MVSERLPTASLGLTTDADAEQSGVGSGSRLAGRVGRRRLWGRRLRAHETHTSVRKSQVRIVGGGGATRTLFPQVEGPIDVGILAAWVCFTQASCARSGTSEVCVTYARYDFPSTGWV